jgi:hypothetical protein
LTTELGSILAEVGDFEKGTEDVELEERAMMEKGRR